MIISFIFLLDYPVYKQLRQYLHTTDLIYWQPLNIIDHLKKKKKYHLKLLIFLEILSRDIMYVD